MNQEIKQSYEGYDLDSSFEIRIHPAKGRGVHAKRKFLKGEVVSISPILFFPNDEYETHGKYTQLDDYTYKWPGGFALALGLGSLFNHEPFGRQNLGFTRYIEKSLIKYTTLRDINIGEEMTISYGDNVWFDEYSNEGDGNKIEKSKIYAENHKNEEDSFFSNFQF
ncbi:SET domain-containing protein 7 [Zancudomyces culisetae]|uniref:SET domain-containing protein 7 n=1 Tax=Zancudomyces culisetae TaxID=1213189 RepID=A0A1R1PYK0_ZANCU|nr:SET domain-containing protein 7 [Zancudomyces culisetae]|eukprot:OMH86015.1 SET domain-containing protein 7 [Zancudomyces culisetae]